MRGIVSDNLKPLLKQVNQGIEQAKASGAAVSYTHLTLPTIYSV